MHDPVSRMEGAPIAARPPAHREEEDAFFGEGGGSALRRLCVIKLES